MEGCLMFLYPNDEGRGRIVGAMLSQVRDASFPTLSIDVQQGTHFSSGVQGTDRVAEVHGAQIQVHGDAVVPFMAQLLAWGIPVCLYPLNGGDEEEFTTYCRRKPRVEGKEKLGWPKDR